MKFKEKLKKFFRRAPKGLEVIGVKKIVTRRDLAVVILTVALMGAGMGGVSPQVIALVKAVGDSFVTHMPDGDKPVGRQGDANGNDADH